jgi:hypothetical protein
LRKLIILITVFLIVGCSSLQKPAIAQATLEPRYVSDNPMDYKALDIREFKNYSDNHKGEKVWFYGEIWMIDDQTHSLHIFVGPNSESVAIKTHSPFLNLYEGDKVIVYGTILGNVCGKNIVNIEVCTPWLIDGWFQK